MSFRIGFRTSHETAGPERIRRLGARAALALTGLVAAASAAAQSPPAPSAPSRPAASAPATPSQDRVLPFEAIVNGAKGGVWVFVERKGVLYAPRDAFEEWRVQLEPGAATIEFKGETYWPLSAVPGFKSKVDYPNQAIELMFSPEVFTALRLTKTLAKRPVASPVLPSVFVNYDLSYTGSALKGASNIRDVGALTEVGVSGKWGVLTSSQVGRNLARDASIGTPRALLRLETTLTKDFPEENRTLRVGDASTRAGMWGRNVYFGGVQYGTNFALTPGFISRPLPVLAGLSAAPSTVELYVNDVLRQVSSVPTGPFAIDNFPVMTGNGEARLVVRDILGRETVITQSFFTSGQLLVPGLDDWSVEAGRVRRDLGVASSNYGDGFASGTWRRGITPNLTLEGRAEVTRDLRTVGLGAATGLPGEFLGTAALVASDHRDLGRGGRWMVGLDRQGLRSGLSLQAQGSSREFRVLGQEDDLLPYKREYAGNWTYFTESLGSFGLGFAALSRYDEPRISTVSANYSINIGKRSSVSVSVSRALAGETGTSVGVNFILPLENAINVTGSGNHHGGTDDLYVAASRSPGPDTPLGWRALAGQQQGERRVEGGLFYLGPRGNLTGEVSASPDRTTMRAGASGGLVYADSSLFVTRRVDQAYAVVEVPGYGGVGVGVGSNVQSRTDAKGVALVPNLWPYQENSIRLDPQDLPVSAEIDSIEQRVVPAWRSAVKVKFPVRSGRGALLRIVLDDGGPAPAGATVHIEGDKEEFYVARRGEAFVTGLQPGSRVQLKWKGAQCTFDVALPPENPDEVPRVGPLACKGVTR